MYALQLKNMWFIFHYSPVWPEGLFSIFIRYLVILSAPWIFLCFLQVFILEWGIQPWKFCSGLGNFIQFYICDIKSLIVLKSCFQMYLPMNMVSDFLPFFRLSNCMGMMKAHTNMQKITKRKILSKEIVTCGSASLYWLASICSLHLRFWCMHLVADIHIHIMVHM